MDAPFPFFRSSGTGRRPLVRNPSMIVLCLAAAFLCYLVVAVYLPYGAAWYPPAVLATAALGFTVRRRRERRVRDDEPDLKDRTTSEIGEAWVLTNLLLRRSPSTADRMHLCRVRDAYLQEFQLRDPEGFQRWIDDSLAGRRCRPDTYIRRETREEDDAVQWRKALRQYVSRGAVHWPHSGSRR